MLTAPDLSERTLGDRTVAQVLGSWHRRDAPEDLLWQAAELFESPSPSNIMGAARWLGVVQDLRDGGLEQREIVRVLVSAAAGEPKGWAPSGRVLERQLTALGDVPYAVRVAEAVVGSDDRRSIAKSLVTLGSAMAVEAGEAPRPEWDAWLTFSVPWTALRAVISALPADRRDTQVARLIGRPGNPNAARVQLRNVLPLLDLATGPLVRESVAKMCTQLRGHQTWGHLVEAAEAGGGPPAPRDGPTDDCTDAVQYWLDKYAAEARKRGIGEAARQLHDARVVTVAAPELADAALWATASEVRRAEIAAELDAQLDGFAFQGFEDFGGGPLATWGRDDLTFRLVPGGTFQRGLGGDEEALIRAASEAAASVPEPDNWFEQFGLLLEEWLPVLRPVQTVRIEPVIVCASSGYSSDPGEVLPFLEGGPFRLLSEAEWEYLARGGVDGHLTWRGHVVPDEDWFLETSRGGADLANRFGLWDFGLQPELCADAWHGSYDGAPSDGTPWWGEGARVARGGAAMLYPWQEVGEWQLLMTAMRSGADQWEFEVAVRPAIGVRLSGERGGSGRKPLDVPTSNG